jgi:hypothetical protein
MTFNLSAGQAENPDRRAGSGGHVFDVQAVADAAAGWPASPTATADPSDGNASTALPSTDVPAHRRCCSNRLGDDRGRSVRARAASAAGALLAHAQFTLTIASTGVEVAAGSRSSGSSPNAGSTLS